MGNWPIVRPSLSLSSLSLQFSRQKDILPAPVHLADHLVHLLVGQPHLPLAGHDLSQLIRAQRSRAVFVKDLQCNVRFGIFGFPSNLERLPQIFLPVLRFSKLAANRIRELGQLNVHPASIAAIRPSELHLGLFCVA